MAVYFSVGEEVAEVPIGKITDTSCIVFNTIVTCVEQPLKFTLIFAPLN